MDDMNIPFNIEKYEKEKLDYELKRFFELYNKHEDNVNEILEFAELWRKFVPTMQSKYRD